MKTPSEKILELISLKNIVPKNAGAHNSIYRGKDITELWYDGTLSEQISNQTFDDIFIGDYIIGKNSGIQYLVADINYRLNTGSVMCTTPHVLMIPEKCIATSSMNADNSVTGAYINCALKTNNLNNVLNDIVNDFDTNHILTHKNYFCNAVTGSYESNGNWYDSTVDLMNECMTYGSNIYHNFRNGTSKSQNITIDKSQLAIFRHRPDLITALNNNGAIQKYWLRDVASESTFCLVGGGGSANNAGASEVQGIRPAFLIY